MKSVLRGHSPQHLHIWLLLFFISMLTNWLTAQPSSSPRVVVVHDALVLRTKFEALTHAAEAEGLVVSQVAAHVSDDELIAALQDQDLLLVDCPRPSSYSELESRLATLRDTISLPNQQVWVGRREKRWVGLDNARGEAIWQYYRHGGTQNLKHLTAYLAKVLSGQSPDAVPPPVALPAAGAYHPDFPGQLDASPAKVLAFLRERHPEALGVVGIGFHNSYIESISLSHIDAMVREAEAQGMIGLPLFYSIGPEADLPTLLQATQLDVLCHLQPVYHQALAQQLEGLDIPVIQGIGWSDGDEASYWDSKVGLSIAATPIYLALPEQVGTVDPMISFVRSDEATYVMARQTQSMIAKSKAYARLRQAKAAERSVAIMVYNYPPGEKNMAASFLNIPQSLERIAAAMAEAGYATEAKPEAFWVEQVGRAIAGLHHPEDLPALEADGLAVRLPLADYQAWFGQLPEAVRSRINDRWGAPETSAYVHDGAFLIPRVAVGHVSILCQPPRGQPGNDNETRMYHDTRVPVNHYYLATYLWVRQQMQAHAIVHLGTHGTLEWMSGKERGLSVDDDPFLALGELPVIYPYIVDDVGEAIQARRRGRATIISHQTPAFEPSGLHSELVGLHDLIHRYQQLDPGEVRSRTAETIIEATLDSDNLKGKGWTREGIRADFNAFLLDLHDYLHELAKQSQPIGLHAFGVSPDTQSRTTTVLQILGEPFLEALLGHEKASEAFVGDFATLTASEPYRWLQSRLFPEAGQAALAPDLPEWEAKARALNAGFGADAETLALLEALDGRFISPGLGGDPIRVPEGLPTGKNLYGFDPSTIPTREAWETGVEAAEAMIEAHRTQHGAYPQKLAFSLWAVETMRHGGVLESEVFYALGIRPVWNSSNRVVGLEVIPREELGRPRVDVVLSATGLYRDQFPNLMEHLAQATAQIADVDESDNPVYANTQRLLADLVKKGMSPEEAGPLAKTRLFGSPTGVYGTGLEDAVLASDTWDDESKLAKLYLARMSYAFGPDASKWGSGPDTTELYAENLKGVEAAVLARSSNLYGMLSTDDPFQYLGGLSLAVRHVTGKSPELLISNQRQPGKARIQSAAHFLDVELQTRSFHPGFLQNMQAEGYSGALELQDMVNNLWGWEVADPAMVTSAQWQRLHEVYVNDALDLGMREWFEEVQPEALVRIIERMLEADRKGYWDPSEATQKELVAAWQELTTQYQLDAGNPAIAQYATSLAAGFGLASAGTPAPAEATPAAAEPPPPSPAAPTTTVRGQELRAQQSPPATEPAAPSLWWLLLVLPFILGLGRRLTARA